MGLFDFFSKKKEQEKEQAEQRRKETEAKELQDKLYFEAVRRDDKKRNFCFVPLISINRTDGQYNNGIHAPDITFEFIETNGHILPKYNFNQNIKLSLKPGKYKVRVFCKVNRNIGIEENAKRKEHDFRDKMSYNGYSEVLKEALFHEATINVNESDICYLLFKLTISAKFKVTSTVINGEVWTNRTLVDFKYGYGFYQTSEGVLRQMCDYCITSPVAYDYPPVDQTALQEYIKNHQHELPKSEQVAKAPAPKATVSKPATPASKTATAKPVESKPATKTTAKPVAKTAETKTTAKTTVKAAPKAETKAPVSKPVPEKPVKKTLNYPNGDKYVGYVLGDKKQGKGVLYYVNGNKYEGDFANDLPHGKGILLFNDPNNKKTKGHLYTGDFVCGKMHGFGVYAYPNGMRYEGGFANDVRDGKGKMYENQKFLFDTLYENGVDVKVYEKPQVVEPVVEEDVCDKEPTREIFKLEQNGYKYVGQAIDGKRHGFGFSFESDGIKIGEFKNDELSGMCICYLYSSGSPVYFGEKPLEESRSNGGYCMTGELYGDRVDFYDGYKNDDKMLGYRILCWDYLPKEPERSADVKIKKYINGFYIGQVDCGYKEGFGCLKFDDGNVYVGQFCEDQMSGFGCLKSQTDLYIGCFYDGEYLNDGMLVQNYGKSNQKILCGEFDGNKFEGQDVSPKGML